ncbi:hypothetical protein EJ06DRAFT_142015 [Trichodelitschia bisporula]|uniref:Uncharacterized protein n=1 Tax=Trichodelitschia bisporula TaxID=703511 RepID=A0A6G1HPS8_9PEZI|nr:hypothetical protein EJ06DRAFT_142015 [Trichodelitschia bisporula]
MPIEVTEIRLQLNTPRIANPHFNVYYYNGGANIRAIRGRSMFEQAGSSGTGAFGTALYFLSHYHVSRPSVVTPTAASGPLRPLTPHGILRQGWDPKCSPPPQRNKEHIRLVLRGRCTPPRLPWAMRFPLVGGPGRGSPTRRPSDTPDASASHFLGWLNPTIS